MIGFSGDTATMLCSDGIQHFSVDEWKVEDLSAGSYGVATMLSR